MTQSDSSSSDDDSADYESPSDSEDDDSDDDGDSSNNNDAVVRKRKKQDWKDFDLFAHKPQKFLKKVDTATQNASTPPTQSRRRRKKVVVDNRKLLFLEQQKLARLRQTNQKRDSLLESSDDDANNDDDSDLEVLGSGGTGRKVNSNKNSSRSAAGLKGPNGSNSAVLTVGSVKKPQTGAVDSTSNAIDLLCDSSPDLPPPRALNRTKIPAACKVLTIDDDSSDSDSGDDVRIKGSTNSNSNNSSSARTTPLLVHIDPAEAALLRQAQEAKARLEQAQRYKADDVHIAVEETIPTYTTPPLTAQRRRAAKQPAAISAATLGKPLRFTCRCAHLTINGTKETITPKDKQSTVVTVREKEALKSLVEKFCKVHSLPHHQATVSLMFDGRKLDTTKTPAFYEMEDEDLIDVSACAPRRLTEEQQRQSARAGFQRTLQRNPKPPPTAKSRGRLLEFSCQTRITTVVATASRPKPRGRPSKKKAPATSSSPKPQLVTKRISLREHECLGVLVQKLCGVLGNLQATKVVMRFDGRVLDTQKSPSFYEMEDEDMIEVSIEKPPQSEPAPQLPQAAVPAAASSRRTTRSSSRNRKNT